MGLLVRDNTIIGLPDGHKALFLAKTIYFDVPECFIAVIARDIPMPNEGETNTLHRQLPEATFVLFDSEGTLMQSLTPYSAREYLEKDALRVIEFERNGRALRWTSSQWDPDRGARVEHRWCEFMGRRIDPANIFIAL